MFVCRSKSRSVDHGFSSPFDLDSLRSKVEGRFESVDRLCRGESSYLYTLNNHMVLDTYIDQLLVGGAQTSSHAHCGATTNQTSVGIIKL